MKNFVQGHIDGKRQAGLGSKGRSGCLQGLGFPQHPGAPPGCVRVCVCVCVSVCVCVQTNTASLGLIFFGLQNK